MSDSYKTAEASPKEPVSGAERRLRRRRQQTMVRLGESKAPKPNKTSKFQRILYILIICDLIALFISGVLWSMDEYFVEHSDTHYKIVQSGYGVVEDLSYHDGWFSDTYRIYDRQVYYMHLRLTSDDWVYIAYPALSNMKNVCVQVLWDETKTRIEVGHPQTLTFDNLDNSTFKIFPTTHTHSGMKFDALPPTDKRRASNSDEFSQKLCLRRAGGSDEDVVVLFMMPPNRSEYFDLQAEKRGLWALKNNALPNEQARFKQFIGWRNWL